MTTLYDTLKNLQLLPNSYQEWTGYRHDVTEWLIAHTEKDTRILLLGIGRSHDIDLRRLSEHTKHLILVDRNGCALKEACTQYDVTPEACYAYDLLGITDTMYHSYADAIVSYVRKEGGATSPEALTHYLIEAVRTLLSSYSQQKWPMPVVDTVVAIGLHSQLLSMMQWIIRVVLETLQQPSHTIDTVLQQCNREVVAWFNTQVFTHTKKNYILGYEIERLQRPGRIEGALQCEVDMQRRIQQGEVICQASVSCVWPFNASQNISYKMLLAQYQALE